MVIKLHGTNEWMNGFQNMFRSGKESIAVFRSFERKIQGQNNAGFSRLCYLLDFYTKGQVKHHSLFAPQAKNLLGAVTIATAIFTIYILDKTS
jgi:hypothetical protein